MPKYLCPSCQGPARRNGSRGYYKCPNCGGLRLVNGKLLTLQQHKLEARRFGPVEQSRPVMTWWEVERMAGWEPGEGTENTPSGAEVRER